MAQRRRSWGKPARRALVAAPAVAVLAAGIALAASLPRTRGTVRVAALERPVEVVRDAAGVPHIFAATDHDAHVALGYVHAQDRLWQMAWQRRVASGRLSEVAGEATLDIDRFLRTLGPYRAAEAAVARLDPASRAALEAYAAGVNAFLDARRALPPEFLVLGLGRPAPWRPADSVAWSKMMAWNLGGNWELELLRAWLEQSVGAARAVSLLPEYPADGPTVLSSAVAPVGARGLGEEPAPDARALAVPADAHADRFAARAGGLLALDARLRSTLRLGGPGVGSNAFVVAGRFTASGAPMLANDPHLGTQIPSQWYLAELHGDTLAVAGATLPGLPGVVIGRNERIAWGFTSLGADVQDLYLERLDPRDPTRALDGEAWRPLTVVRETISVRGRSAPVVWAARASRHGPLISDALDELPTARPGGGAGEAGGDGPGDGPTALAMRWTALDEDDRTVAGFLALDRARDWPSFLAALREVGAPSQNALYADVDGHIGYTAIGHVPIRSRGDGRRPVPGWDDAHAWRGYVAWEDLPRVLDPPAGWLASANERVAAGGPFLTTDWALPYRAARVRRALAAAVASGKPLAAGDLAAIQHDTASDVAAALRDALAASVPPTDTRRAAALARVAAWDGDNRAGDVAPTIVQAWLFHLVSALVADDLPDARLASYLTLDDLNHRNAEFALRTLRNDALGWCDDLATPPRENCGEIAGRALDEALDDLTERLGPRLEAWRWGRLHRARYAHAPLGEVAGLRALFERSIAAGGDAFSPNVGAPSWSAPFTDDHAPSYRQVIDLGAPAGRYGLAPGQSGLPQARHFADRLRPYHEGADLALTLGRSAVDGAVLHLVPGAGP